MKVYFSSIRLYNSRDVFTVEVDDEVDDTLVLIVTDKCPPISSVIYTSCLNCRRHRTITPVYTSATCDHQLIKCKI